jgi:hypothetical protein
MKRNRNADKATRSGLVIIMIIDVRHCTGVFLNLVSATPPTVSIFTVCCPAIKLIQMATSAYVHSCERERERERKSVVTHVMVRQVHDVDHDILPCLER